MWGGRRGFEPPAPHLGPDVPGRGTGSRSGCIQARASPGTLANIRRQPNVEVCFIDVVLRKAVRVTGTASIHRKDGADAELREAFEERWAAYHSYMSSFVKIDVRRAELVLSPAYDVGFTEEELRQANLAKLNAL